MAVWAGGSLMVWWFGGAICLDLEEAAARRYFFLRRSFRAMSASGTSRTSACALHMSAFDPKRTFRLYPSIVVAWSTTSSSAAPTKTEPAVVGRMTITMFMMVSGWSGASYCIHKRPKGGLGSGRSLRRNAKLQWRIVDTQRAARMHWRISSRCGSVRCSPVLASSTNRRQAWPRLSPDAFIVTPRYGLCWTVRARWGGCACNAQKAKQTMECQVKASV